MNMRTIGIAVIVVALVAAFTGIVSATPTGATGLSVSANETKTESAGLSEEAMGGNVTKLDITITQQTRKWQGYYGDVSGGIVLMDSTGYSMYNWTIDSPTGEIYATPLSGIPGWTNYTHAANTTNVSVAFNLSTAVTGVVDNATDTFNETHTPFYLAGKPVATSIGPCARTMNGTSSSVWETVILTNGTVTAVETDYMFVGLIRESDTSFKNTSCDYQMIVPEDPLDDSATTTYYFYVELT